MSARRLLSLFFGATMCGVAGGCALLSKQDPVTPAYFSPERLDVAPVVARNARPGLSVRLGRVGGGAYLKERFVYREADLSIGFSEERRWTERPEVYLQRAIEQSLFEERGLKRSLSTTAPTLTVDLIEFEEVRGPSPRVRLRASYALHDEQTVFHERSFVVEKPLAPGTEGARGGQVAAGLGDALGEAVAKIVEEVVAELSARGEKPM